MLGNPRPLHPEAEGRPGELRKRGKDAGRQAPPRAPPLLLRRRWSRAPPRSTVGAWGRSSSPHLPFPYPCLPAPRRGRGRWR
jgi:hypothetical protein